MPLEHGDTFTGNQVIASDRIVEAAFTERLCGIGDFTLTIPYDSPMAPYLQRDQIVNLDNMKFGIIDNLDESAAGIVISGYDLKKYLDNRITLYPATPIKDGLQGYDAINGASTEQVVKYFVKNNITAPSDPLRVIPGFVVAENLNRGLPNDCYMSRFETLTEVMAKNLQPAGMGYRVEADLEHSQFIFDVIEGVDRTAWQTEHPRFVIGAGRRNLQDYSYSDRGASLKTAFYASLSSSRSVGNTLTNLYFPGDIDSRGALRREQHLNVSVNLPAGEQYAALKPYALKMAESYIDTQNITVDVTLLQDSEFALGDFVSVEMRGGLFGYRRVTDAQIVTWHTLWRTDRQTVIEIGEERKTRFDLIDKKINNL